MKREYTQVGEKFRCPVCLELFGKYGIGNHYWRMHTDEGLEHRFPTGEDRKNKHAWNKGLTKETNQIIKEKTERTLERYRKGELVGSQKGKPLSQELKDNLSKKKIAFLLENPDKVPYLLNHSSKESYPEKIFRVALEENKIEGWVQEYQNSIYRYDFAFIDLKIDIEIDGATHQTEKVMKIDKRRDEWSREQGWEVLRFKASEVKENVTKCINSLLDIISVRGQDG